MMSGGFPCICNLKKNKQTCGERTPRKPKQSSAGSGSLTCSGSLRRGRGRRLPAWVAAGPHRGQQPGPRPLSGCARRCAPAPRLEAGGAQRRRLPGSAVARGAAAASGKGPTSNFQRQALLSDTRGVRRGGGSPGATFPEFSAVRHNARPTPQPPAKVEGKGSSGQVEGELGFLVISQSPATPRCPPRNRETQPSPRKKKKKYMDPLAGLMEQQKADPGNRPWDTFPHLLLSQDPRTWAHF